MHALAGFVYVLLAARARRSDRHPLHSAARMIGPTARAITVLLALIVGGIGNQSQASVSAPFVSEAVTARLITANEGIAPQAATISAGLQVDLGPEWKTYWRTPGEVGIPPEIDWTGSENVADVRLFWPAPHRFHAFGIENFGYKGRVVFPLSIALAEPGQPAKLRAQVTMLTCSIVCVPQNFALALDLPSGGALDQASADLISEWIDKVPLEGDSAGARLRVAALETGPEPAVVFEVETDRPFVAPDVFPEISEGTTFGPPDIRLGDGGRRLWARVPLTYLEAGADGVAVTVTDGERAVSLARAALGAEIPSPPYARAAVAPGLLKLMRMSLVALVGGLILNLMPCVLPVLSIKLSSALKVAGLGRSRVRSGFLMSAAGVMTFMWVLAGAVIALKAMGSTVGWGLQFQNPFFLVAMVVVIVLFAANMFGLFEINLPAAVMARVSTASAQKGHLGDFLTGAFAAVLATPCSAPFLGTAVAFALAGRPLDILVIFTALGAGLAVPYVAVALRPTLVEVLPRPGRWTVLVKAVLGLLLVATAAWLLWVLDGVAGEALVIAVMAILVAVVALLSLSLPETGWLRHTRAGLATLLIATAVVIPLALRPEASGASQLAKAQEIDWVPFDRARIARLVSGGQVVFLDITADWCITCKANKALVINRSAVADILNGGKVVPMQADWTRPDEAIARFLRENGRYGIPFNAAFGPAAPDGIILPEVLTTELVLDALGKAAGTDIGLVSAND